MRFLVIGEQCTDVFVYGKCDRLSPEAPVPVFMPIKEVKNKGMAGNVVENLHALNAKFKGKIKIDECLSSGDIVKRRFVDKKSNHIFLRVDHPDQCSRIKFTPSVIKKIKAADIVIISDYDKGFLTTDDIVQISKLTNAKIFIDSKRKLPMWIIEHVDYIKVNEVESKQQDIWMDQNKFIITLGGKGTVYREKEYLVKEVETIDVSGAGDTFLAALTFEYAKTKSIPKAIIFANKMASLVVTKRGVSTI